MLRLALITIVFFTFFSCTNTQDEIRRMKKSFSKKEFVVDTILTKSSVINKYNIRNMQIKLNENGKYFFKNAPQDFLRYEGVWDLSDDNEISFFIFKLSNGEVQKNRNLCLVINKFEVCFKEK